MEFQQRIAEIENPTIRADVACATELSYPLSTGADADCGLLATSPV